MEKENYLEVFRAKGIMVSFLEVVTPLKKNTAYLSRGLGLSFDYRSM